MWRNCQTKHDTPPTPRLSTYAQINFVQLSQVAGSTLAITECLFSTELLAKFLIKNIWIDHLILFKFAKNLMTFFHLKIILNKQTKPYVTIANNGKPVLAAGVPALDDVLDVGVGVGEDLLEEVLL
jgi:hypothetical protein